MDKLVQFIKRGYIRLKYFRYGWRGHYKSWEEASAACTGYDAANILQKVCAATLKVKNGEAVYERDAMLFDAVEYSWPLLSHLLWLAGKNNRQLSVLDFGGSLGSSFFQNRYYLKDLSQVAWSVVEQPDFVTTGQKQIAGNGLEFFDNIDRAIRDRGPHQVLLLSCVLPYVPDPYQLLGELAQKSIPWLIVENTYFNPEPANRLTIQKVPPVYYDASYPAWFLHYEAVVKALEHKYEMVTEYNNDQFLYLEGEKVMYRGFVMRLKS